MAVNKNFVVKNGLEVASNLIYADAENSLVGVGTTVIDYNLHVIGGIGATDVNVTGFVTTRSLNVSGDTFFGNVLATGIGVTSLNVSGIATILNSITTGVSTVSGNIHVGSGGTTLTTLTGGKVGIATTNALHRFQVGAATTLGFTTTTSGLFVVTYDGKVGVQTGQPNTQLHVVGNEFVTGVITATTFVGNINSGVGTIITLGTTNLTATYADVGISTVDYLSGTNLYYTGISTLGNVIIGSGSTDLIVNGNARVTGILTVGSSSITLNGNTDIVNVGAGVTLSGVGNITCGIITASRFVGRLEGNINSDVVDAIDGYVNVGLVTSISGTNLNYTGVGTITTLNSTNFTSPSISGTSGTITTLNSTNFTSPSISGTSGTITTLNSTNLTSSSITGTAGTITTLNSTIGNITYLNSTTVNSSGVSTFAGNVRISSNTIASTSGSVVYYGDGSNLSGVTYGIGIRSDGNTIAGSGVTVVNFTGSGISTVTASSGIATIFVEGGSVGPASQVIVTDDTSSATTHYITFSGGTSGSQAIKVDSTGLTYNPSTNTITANLTGTASTATNATNATNSTNSAITDTTSSVSTHYITFVDSTSGNRTLRVDSTGLTYNPSTNTLSGNISGNAATVTTNANLTGDITSTGNSTSIAAGVIVNADISNSAAIAVSKLAESTISGVTLGNNLSTLTRGTYLTGSNYNGSSATTWAVDADSANTASKVVVRDASGDFAGNIITCVDLNSTSDITLKKDVRPFENALATINQLNGVHFTWKKDDRKSIGVIAQEVEEVLPELVTETYGNKTVNYNGLIGILIESIKELSAKVEALESKIQ